MKISLSALFISAALPLAAMTALAQPAIAKPFDPATQCGHQDMGSPPLPMAKKDVLLTPKQLRSDLTLIAKVLKHCHPDISHSADPAVLAKKIAALSASFDHNMTREEAWRALATLNPVLADGHVGIFHANGDARIKAHLANGGVFFPFEAVAKPDGTLFVRAALGGGKSPLAGARILSIDGKPSAKIIDALMARENGDTVLYRANLLSRRFASSYWAVFGAPKSFRMVLEKAGKRIAITIPGSAATPEDSEIGDVFNRTFRFTLLPHKSALLTINLFYWPHHERYMAFMHSAFARMKEAGTRTLIIDIRENGGGDDGFWKNGILPYVGHGKYLFASSYIKRELPGHTDDGYKIGDVAKAKLDSWTTLDADNPLHFSGKVYVLEGGITYSSSILFVNVMQHFGFGTIAGEGGLARANQSGGVYSTLLPNTGLIVSWPRFILIRPSGKSTPKFVEPDIVIKDDPLRPMAAVRQLMQINAGR